MTEVGTFRFHPPLPDRTPRRQRGAADVGRALPHDGAEDALAEPGPPEEDDLEDDARTEPRGRLRRELDRVKRDRDRYEALLRASHRVVGVPPPPAPKGPEKGRRRRGPTIRALAAAQALQAPPERVSSTLADGPRTAADLPDTTGADGCGGSKNDTEVPPERDDSNR